MVYLSMLRTMETQRTEQTHADSPNNTIEARMTTVMRVITVHAHKHGQ